jgi:hypothetical protein
LIAYRLKLKGRTSVMESYALLLAATLNAGTVLALASLGLLINEKAGIVNLGAEGMMLCAAIAGFATVVHTGNDWLGFAAGMAWARAGAMFGLLVIWLNTNQYATGLALSLFGVRLLCLCRHQVFVQEKLPNAPQYAIPGWRHAADRPGAVQPSPAGVPDRAVRARADLVPVPHPQPAWCCAAWANRPSRHMRWAIRCAASACWR